MEKRLCFGYVEHIRPLAIDGGGEFVAPSVLAKVDTGAFSGVVHAENMTEQDGRLIFKLLGRDDLTISTDQYKVRQVRNTHGSTKKRYLVNMTFVVDGIEYESLVGLDDRRKMQFNALIGRAFLNKNQILVDTQKNINLDQEWNKMGENQ